MIMRVLVTGGGGFIGSATARRLRGDGFEPRAGVRRDRADQSCVRCDLDDPEQIAAAIKGADAVVHAGYGVEARMERQCAALLEAMRAANTRRLIHLSSIAVYGGAEGLVAETTRLAPIDRYGAGKAACERLVQEWARSGAGAAMILRPGIVYGRGSPFWIDKMATRIRCGAWGTFEEAGEGVAALVHVDDVAALISSALARLDASAPDVSTMNVAGPQTPSWNVYFTELASALGSPKLTPLDGAAIARRQKLAIAAKLWRKLGLPGLERAALAPTPGEMALFARKADYRSDAAESRAGFTPRIDMAEGLRRSL